MVFINWENFDIGQKCLKKREKGKEIKIISNRAYGSFCTEEFQTDLVCGCPGHDLGPRWCFYP